MQKIKIDEDGWCRCGKCKHKLFRLGDKSMEMILTLLELEIKCHSCKEINSFEFEGRDEK